MYKLWSFFCTKRSIVERLNIGRRVFVKSFFKKQDVLEKVITMLKCQLCERMISYTLWKTRNYSFLSYQSRSFPSLLSLHIKPENLSPWGCNLLLSLDTRLRNELICRKSERCIKAGNGEPVSTYIFLLITPQFYNIPVAHTFVFLCYNCFYLVFAPSCGGFS